MMARKVHKAYTLEQLNILRTGAMTEHVNATGHDVESFEDGSPQGWGWGCRQCDPDLFNVDPPSTITRGRSVDDPR